MQTQNTEKMENKMIKQKQ